MKKQTKEKTERENQMKRANHRNLLVKPKIKVKQFKKCAGVDCKEMINLKSKYCFDHKDYLRGVNRI